MEQLVQALQGHAISIIVSILGIVVARFVRRLLLIIEEKYSIDIDNQVEKYIGHITRKAVRVVYQTFVKDLKKEGKFGLKEKKEALIKSLDMVYSEAKRCGMMSYIKNRDLVKDVESELVKVKNEGKRSDKVKTNIKPKKRRSK